MSEDCRQTAYVGRWQRVAASASAVMELGGWVRDQHGQRTREFDRCSRRGRVLGHVGVGPDLDLICASGIEAGKRRAATWVHLGMPCWADSFGSANLWSRPTPGLPHRVSQPPRSPRGPRIPSASVFGTSLCCAVGSRERSQTGHMPQPLVPSSGVAATTAVALRCCAGLLAGGSRAKGLSDVSLPR